MLLSESHKKRLQELAGLNGAIKESQDNIEEISINDIELPRDYVHDHLNEEVWDESGNLRPEIQEKLEKIAKDFHEYIGVNVPIEDIWFTGSLANYNWTDFSDVDLHILIDYDLIPGDEGFVRDYLGGKKSIWNDKHEITIRGFDVELYAQDTKEPHRSTGVYSIQNEDWVRKPSLEKPEVDRASVKEKVKSIADRIEEIEALEDPDKTQIKGEKLKDKIKKMRQSGLERAGEFSSENLAFKYLRNNGYLERLFNAVRVSYDKTMSITEEESPATFEFDEKKNLVTSAEVLNIVKNLHANEVDFSEEDLAQRISVFPSYELTEVPLSTLDLDGIEVMDAESEADIEEYSETLKNNPDYPPIVYDPVNKGIIDGAKTVRALGIAGYDTARVFVGIASRGLGIPNASESVRKIVRKQISELFNSKGFHASMDDWLEKWSKKGIDVQSMSYGDGVDMGFSKRDKLLSEEFASKAQQRYFYAMADKPGKKGKKFKKWSKEFSDDTDFDKIPEKVTEEEASIEAPKKHKLSLEKNIKDEHGDNLDFFKDFIIFCCKEAEINEPTIVYLRGTRGDDKLRTTASYNPDSHDVNVYCKARHMVDIMRSIAHELMHMKQNLEDRLNDNSGGDGSPEENEAHAFSGLMIRKYGREKPKIYEGYKNNKNLLK